MLPAPSLGNNVGDGERTRLWTFPSTHDDDSQGAPDRTGRGVAATGNGFGSGYGDGRTAHRSDGKGCRLRRLAGRSAMAVNGMNAARIAGVGFDEADLAVLRSLLGLMQGHLQWRWQVDSAGPAALLLVNLDALVVSALPRAGRRVDCSQRPYSHGPGVLHRPFRATQLLRLLQELEQAAPADASGSGRAPNVAAAMPAAAPAAAGPTMAYRLAAWPLDWQDWPESCWPLLAMLAASARTVVALRQESGMAAATVDQCLRRLLAAGLLQPQPAPVAVPVADLGDMAAARARPRRDGGWARLSARLARALGLAS